MTKNVIPVPFYTTLELENKDDIPFEKRVELLREIAGKAEIEFQARYKDINSWFYSRL